MVLTADSISGLTLPVLRALLDQMGPAAFASPTHRDFYMSHDREIVLSGWMGAGKSRVLCEKAWWLARQYPGATFALFRKVAASIPATTARTFWRDVVDLRYLARQNRSENWLELTNGARIYFLGLDPDPLTGVPSKVGSLDAAWIGVDEAVELTPEDWIMLLGRLRDPRMPWHQIAAATNPGPPKHWLRDRMATHGRMLYAKSNRFLSREYVEMLGSLPDTAAGRRLGKGEWAGAEGMIWTLPDDQVRAPSAVPKRTIAGLDWGFVHAFACEVVGQSGSGREAVVEEVYAKGLGVDQIAPRLAEIFERRDVSAVFCDPSEPGLMAELARHLITHRQGHSGCRLRTRVEPARNDVLTGIQAVDKQIRLGLIVDPTCQGLLGELPGYTWAPNRAGGFFERPVEVNDDACDALRYAVMALEPDPDNPWASLVSAGGIA
jgi:phage terminase large subunit